MRRFFCLFAAAALTLATVSCEDESETPNSSSTGNDSIPEGYVDLGLPSGTLWKSDNENRPEKSIGHFTFDEAYAAFGEQLPTEEQWEELIYKGLWEWNGSGYVVTGVNGNYIQLPAAGIRNGTTGAVELDGTGGGELVEYGRRPWRRICVGVRCDFPECVALNTEQRSVGSACA